MQEDSDEQAITLNLAPSNKTVGSIQNVGATVGQGEIVVSDGTINLNSFKFKRCRNHTVKHLTSLQNSVKNFEAIKSTNFSKKIKLQKSRTQKIKFRNWVVPKIKPPENVFLKTLKLKQAMQRPAS